MEREKAGVFEQNYIERRPTANRHHRHGECKSRYTFTTPIFTSS